MRPANRTKPTQRKRTLSHSHTHTHLLVPWIVPVGSANDFLDTLTISNYRTLIQIKSHAQKVLKREEAGDDIFAPLSTNKDRVETLIADLSVLFEQREEKTIISPKNNDTPSKTTGTTMTTAWCNNTPTLAADESTLLPVEQHYSHHPHNLHHHHNALQPPAMLNGSCTTVDSRFRFTVADTQPEMAYGLNTIYQATIGKSVGFAFPPAPSAGMASTNSTTNAIMVPPTSPLMLPMDGNSTNADGSTDAAGTSRMMQPKRTPFHHKTQLPTVGNSSSDLVGNLVLVSPAKNSKCHDVLAAAALCELSGFGRKRGNTTVTTTSTTTTGPSDCLGDRNGGMPHIVSP